MASDADSETDEPDFIEHVFCTSCEHGWIRDEYPEKKECPNCGTGPDQRRIEERIVRAKWTMDGAETIDEMADKMEQRAEWIRSLKDDRWELDGEVTDDHAMLLRDKE